MSEGADDTLEFSIIKDDNGMLSRNVVNKPVYAVRHPTGAETNSNGFADATSKHT
jgi:hypothetical protein